MAGKSNTYVKRLLEHYPAGLGLYIEILQIVGIEGRTQAIDYGAIVVGIFVGGGNTQDVRTNAGILLNILHIFLQL